MRSMILFNQGRIIEVENIIFSLDPGSCKCEWCVVTREKELVAGGHLLPRKIKASNDVRIGDMCADLRVLLNEWMPKIVLIEWCSGHVGRRRHRGAGAYLSIYGISVGALWWTIVTWKESLPEEQQSGIEVVLIDEILWTGGIDKFSRATAIANLFPRYNITKDPGHDLADSIGLCVWYLRDQAIRSGHFA